mmetsp:Transcript_19450/g.43088  ORF Transcript_19450/g.43088 Transcript_19450/m.43088 type:complete len:96 (+) Transcript_19450:157-444(+)
MWVLRGVGARCCAAALGLRWVGFCGGVGCCGFGFAGLVLDVFSLCDLLWRVRRMLLAFRVVVVGFCSCDRAFGPFVFVSFVSCCALRSVRGPLVR